MYIVLALQYRCALFEKGVIEGHHLLQTSSIGTQLSVFEVIPLKILVYPLIQKTPVGVSPSVDTLFDIPYDKIVKPFVCTILYQRQNIAPLHL